MVIFTWLPLVVMSVIYLFMAIIAIVALAVLVGSIVPFVPPMRQGMEIWILFNLGTPENAVVALTKKLDEALAERDKARRDLKHTLESNNKESIDEAHVVFSVAERKVEKARWRLDRLIGVAYLTGRGREFKRFVK